MYESIGKGVECCRHDREVGKIRKIGITWNDETTILIIETN